MSPARGPARPLVGAPAATPGGPRDPLVVEARFNGPDGFGNGGWTSGLLAAHVDRPIGGRGAVVTLRRPPPLETALAVQADAADAVRLLDGTVLVAEAVRVAFGVDAVPSVPYATALAAEHAYAGAHRHPFPRCFVCGPKRHPPDGMGLRPGTLCPGRTACTWVPDPSLAGADGRVRPAAVWAALDCPGGWAAGIAGRPMVLGRIAARIDTVPAVGERCVVVGARVGGEARKTWTVTTAYGADGRELGRAAATWIEVPR